MRVFLLLTVLVLTACSTTRDPHRPKLIVANANGGAVTLDHGQGLWIPLGIDSAGTHEWRRVEPQILTVVPVGAPYPNGIYMTPVRTGTEKLRFEYRPLSGEATAQKVVSYDVTVR